MSSKWRYNPAEDTWTDPHGKVWESTQEVRQAVRSSHAVAEQESHAPSLGAIEHCPTDWPILSDAAGVHPEQIDEMKGYLAGEGVETRFTPDGRCVMENREHRRKVLKAMNLHDRNSYDGH